MGERYLSLHLSQIHNVKNIKKEYMKYFKFFKGNFEKEIPRDRSIKILDMGCGLGEALFSLRKLGYYNVIGIDNSKECVDFCNKMGYAKCYLGNALDYFERCSDQYDVILFNDIIEHFQLQDMIHILQGMMRCLNRGGVILIKTMNAGNGILAVTTLYTDLTHKTMFDEFSLKEIIVRAGFHSEKVRIKKSNLYCFYANPLNYIAWGTEIVSSLAFQFYFMLHNKKNTTLQLFEK